MTANLAPPAPWLRKLACRAAQARPLIPQGLPQLDVKRAKALLQSIVQTARVFNDGRIELLFG